MTGSGPPPTGPNRYGRRYWRVSVSSDVLGVDKDGDIYLYADDLVVHKCGALMFVGGLENEAPSRGLKWPPSGSHILLVIPADKWFSVFAAATDGRPEALDIPQGKPG